MVGIAKLVIAPGCGPGGRGFESHYSPHLCSTKRLQHTKVLDFQGLFVFLRAFFRVEIFCWKMLCFSFIQVLNSRDNRTFEKSLLFWYDIDRKKESEDLQMKNGYAMVRRLKLTPFELRVAIEALNAKRLKQKANGIDNRATSNLILHLLDALEA